MRVESGTSFVLPCFACSHATARQCIQEVSLEVSVFVGRVISALQQHDCSGSSCFTHFYHRLRVDRSVQLALCQMPFYATRAYLLHIGVDNR